MLINTKTELKTLDGQPLQKEGLKITIGIVISGILSGSRSEFDAKTAWRLAKSFTAQDTVELSDTELKKLKLTIENDTMFIPLIRGQILEMLEQHGT